MMEGFGGGAHLQELTPTVFVMLHQCDAVRGANVKDEINAQVLEG